MKKLENIMYFVFISLLVVVFASGNNNDVKKKKQQSYSIVKMHTPHGNIYTYTPMDMNYQHKLLHR